MRRLRPAPLTIGLMIAAVASAILVYADPWGAASEGPRLVSNQSAARRIFPNLGERDLAQASLEIHRQGGPRIRLVPGSDGRHQLFVEDALLGWADSDAVDGLWSSLRMATTLRAAPSETALGAPQGSVEIVIGDEHLILVIGGRTGDGAGLYGTLVHENDARWVVEAELGAILEQPAAAWLTQRLLPLEPSSALRLEWGPRVIARGDDGLWRVEGGEPGLLLATAAVETRVDRLFGAAIAPLLPRETVSEADLTRWLTITTVDGQEHTLGLAGECPDHSELRIVDRGPGLLGCIRSDLVSPWPLADPEAALFEPQLIPYAYGRILAVDARRPNLRRLRRYGGGWVVDDPTVGIREVSEPEVYRWLTDLATTAVELSEHAVVPTVELAFESDAGVQIVLRCGEHEGGWICQRDEGPPLRLVRGGPLELEFSAETFADRRLITLDAAAVRSLEILPGPRGDSVRQGVRLDLGIWRLDAPEHPDGGGALDEIRLESMLATLGGLRAERWAEVPPGGVLRTLRIERSPARGESPELAVDLYPGCVVQVSGQPRAAAISDAACALLSDDLLFIDPLRYWIGRARTIEIIALREGGRSTILRESAGGVWAVDGEAGEAGEEAGDGGGRWSSELRLWDSWRARGIRRGEPRGEPEIELKIRRTDGVAIAAELGADWLRIAGQGWYYLRDDGASGASGEHEAALGE